jgi:hypothetical protein
MLNRPALAISLVSIMLFFGFNVLASTDGVQSESVSDLQALEAEMNFIKDSLLTDAEEDKAWKNELDQLISEEMVEKPVVASETATNIEIETEEFSSEDQAALEKELTSADIKNLESDDVSTGQAATMRPDTTTSIDRSPSLPTEVIPVSTAPSANEAKPVDETAPTTKPKKKRGFN